MSVLLNVIAAYDGSSPANGTILYHTGAPDGASTVGFTTAKGDLRGLINLIAPYDVPSPANGMVIVHMSADDDSASLAHLSIDAFDNAVSDQRHKGGVA